ncbi:MAG TPA: hypothetical protein VI757_01760 [Bacteroidia bacterium]|nr:hypothetical protein [Bacteroidia bacterium]
MHLAVYGDSFFLVQSVKRAIVFLQLRDVNVRYKVHEPDALLESLRLKNIPDVLIILYPFFTLASAQVIEQAIAICPQLKILILSSVSDEEAHFNLVRQGACGIVPASANMYHVVDCCRHLTENEYLSNECLTASMFHALRKDDFRKDDFPVRMNERKIKILNCLWNEMTHKQSATFLKLKLKIVDNDIQELHDDIGAKNVTGILKYALKHHLLNPVYELAG